MLNFVDGMFPIFVERLYWGRFSFEHVLISSNYVYGIAGESGRSKAVLGLSRMLIYLVLYPIVNKLGVMLVDII